jgi:3-isopropylmalate/(R)-2-methylmalate dehydratase small subunit
LLIHPNIYQLDYATLLEAHRTSRFAAAGEHRHRSNHPEAVPEAHRTHWLRAVPVLRLALNRPGAAGATILITGPNFGCGSSREHAPWALADYGFRAIIAPSFADIFFGNCCQNGLLPVVLPEHQVRDLDQRVAASAGGYELAVDLECCRVSDDRGFEAAFEIDDYRREMLLQGLDEIGRTLQQEAEISAFERRRVAVGASA